MSKVSKKVI